MERNLDETKAMLKDLFKKVGGYPEVFSYLGQESPIPQNAEQEKEIESLKQQLRSASAVLQELRQQLNLHRKDTTLSTDVITIDNLFNSFRKR